MTAPSVERPQPAETWDAAIGLALLWVMPVVGFVLVLLGLS